MSDWLLEGLNIVSTTLSAEISPEAAVASGVGIDRIQKGWEAGAAAAAGARLGVLLESLAALEASLAPQERALAATAAALVKGRERAAKARSVVDVLSSSTQRQLLPGGCALEAATERAAEAVGAGLDGLVSVMRIDMAKLDAIVSGDGDAGDGSTSGTSGTSRTSGKGSRLSAAAAAGLVQKRIADLRAFLADFFDTAIKVNNRLLSYHCN